MKKVFALSIFLIFAFCFINGIADLLIYARRSASLLLLNSHIRYIHDPDKSREELIRVVKDTHYRLKYRKTNAYGQVPLNGDYGTYRIGEHGQRLIPEKFQHRNAKKRLLILGSSQTFGYLTPDDESFAVKLIERLPDYKIDNFSGSPQNTHQSLMNWIRMNDLGYQYDTVIILNGPVDYFNYSTEMNQTNENTSDYIASYRVIKRIMSWIIPKGKGSPSKSKDHTLPETMPVHSIISDYNSLVQYGKEIGTKTYIFIPPTPYGNNAKVEYLEKDFDPFTRRIIDESIVALGEEVKNEPQIIDLTNLFDNKGSMFIDIAGHLNQQGNIALANAVAEVVKANE